MPKLSKKKQWDKGVRNFNRIRNLVTEFDADVKLIEMGMALRQGNLTNEEATKILTRQTSNSLNRIRDYVNKRGGNINDQWVAQVTWIRNMASHSVVWHDTFFYAPADIDETRKVLKISGVAGVDDRFASPLVFRKDDPYAFHELMEFFATTMKQAIKELKDQIMRPLAFNHRTRLNALGSTITMQPMTWSDYASQLSQ